MISPEMRRVQVLVVGAGPGGSAVAYHLAKAGIDVIVLEKSVFPRDKICGDGLTPTAVKEILAMGIKPDEEPGWQVNKGLTVLGGGHRVTLPWAVQMEMPEYSMTRARKSLDHRLIQQAQQAGAVLVENCSAQDLIEDADGWAVGVKALIRDPETRKREEVEFRADYVIDCSGAVGRLAVKAGRVAADNRPMAVAARAYFKSPRGNEDWMESHLELWSGKRGESDLLPGYGWVFPMGNGIVNVGLGSVSSGKQATNLPYKQIFDTWISNLPDGWGISAETQLGQMRSAPLPMAFNRSPLYEKGLLLVGDAAGMISPFNGEGIGPAMFAGRKAAEALVQAFGRKSRAHRELALATYAEEVKRQLGGYYTLGRIFVRLIEKPQIMHVCTKYGLGRRHLMRFVHMMLSDGFERHGGGLSDRFLAFASKVVPNS